MNDRIKLAEAMFPDHEFTTNPVGEWLMVPDGRWDRDYLITNAPDPFTDANDDYAVLEWMRPEDAVYSKPIMGPKHEAWRDFIFELRLLQAKRSKASDAIFESYVLGDYARAALKVIE